MLFSGQERLNVMSLANRIAAYLRTTKMGGNGKLLKKLVGPPGFEPGTSCTPSNDQSCVTSMPLS